MAGTTGAVDFGVVLTERNGWFICFYDTPQSDCVLKDTYGYALGNEAMGHALDPDPALDQLPGHIPLDMLRQQFMSVRLDADLRRESFHWMSCINHD